METLKSYLDLEGRRATIYLLWRRALQEYREGANAQQFLSSIELITSELRLLRISALELISSSPVHEKLELIRRIEVLEDEHLRLMVADQQSKVRGEDGAGREVFEVEGDISDLMQELSSES